MAARLFVVLSLALAIFASGPDPEWQNSKSVVFLDDDNFDEAREKHPKMMVFFYAPWCGHCKTTKPDYTDASEEVMFTATMAAVDCTQSKNVCEKFGVKGYPSIKWFDSSDSEGTEYTEGRSSGAFITYIKKQVGDVQENFEGVDFSKMRVKQLKKILKDRGVECKGCTDKSEFLDLVVQHHADEKKKPAAKKQGAKKSTLVNGMTFAQERRYKAAKEVADKGWEENGDVKHLVDYEFEAFREQEGKLAVMFYAPWCGHCKTMKPEWAKASTELKGQVTLSAMDCDINPETCRKYNANSYPTVLFFKDKDDTKGKPVAGRTAQAMVKFLTKQMDPNAVPEKFENEPTWGADSGDVIFMTEDHWDQYRQEHPKMWVMFYAPWCGHCKSMKPSVGKAATQLKDAMPVVAVDCTEHTGLCAKFGIKGYPSIQYFDSADDKGEEYTGSRDEGAIVTFCKEKAQAGAAPAEDTKPAAADDDDDVPIEDKKEL